MQDSHTLCFSRFATRMLFSGAAARPVEHPWLLGEAITDFCCCFGCASVWSSAEGITELTQAAGGFTGSRRLKVPAEPVMMDTSRLQENLLCHPGNQFASQRRTVPVYPSRQPRDERAPADFVPPVVAFVADTPAILARSGLYGCREEGLAVIPCGSKPPAPQVSSSMGSSCPAQSTEVRLPFWKLPTALPSLNPCSKTVFLPPGSGSPVAAERGRFTS